MIRDENITIRVPADDKARYRDTAGKRGLTLSRWIRGLMDGKQSPAPGQLKILLQILAEIQVLRFQVAQVGKNLNQLVKLVHSRRVHSIEGQSELLEEVGRTCDAARKSVDGFDKRLSRQLRESPEEGEGSLLW